VVAQLLALMDGMVSRGQVVVIGATNIPNALDPALRRPGRFDREIVINIPDQASRLQILNIHSRGMPLQEDVDLQQLARITHGFVGADLEALCKEAAMIGLRSVLADLDTSAKQVPYDILMGLKISAKDFIEAMKEIEPSAIREVFVEVPGVEWDEVGGLNEIKEEIRDAVEWPLKYPSILQRMGARVPKGILLSGPPGTGKTLLARAVATQSEANFISVKGPELFSKWVGESEKAVREVFHKAKQAAPCIIFFDEIDALTSNRNAGSDPVVERVIGQLLTEMDGVEELRGIVVIGATNRLDLVDSALLRPGRFDLIFTLPLPDIEVRKQIIQIHTKNKPLEKDVDLDTLARESNGLTGADLNFLCDKAALLTIREWLKEKGEGDSGAEKLCICARHFSKALADLQNRTGGRRCEN
ncbi:MAG: AAA family ATPase, partial [Bacillota bacterium]